MKQLLLYILLFTSLSATAQRYDNITNDWCKMNLKGKVKEMRVMFYSKRHHIDSNDYQEQVYYFNKEGFVKKATHAIYDKGISKGAMTVVHNAPEKVDEHSFIITEVQKPDDTVIWANMVANQPEDTLWGTTQYTIINDTLYEEEHIPPQGKEVHLIIWVHHNPKQQILYRDIYILDYWGDTSDKKRIRYTYNSQGQRIEETTRNLKEGAERQTIMINKIITTDPRGNPTHQVLQKPNIEGTEDYIKTTYKYYE